MLMEGEFANAAHHPKLLDLVAKRGDSAMNFLWQNKGTLAAGATLAAVLDGPEPFLTGAKDIASIACESVVKPVVGGFFAVLNVVLIAIAVLLLAVIGLAYKHGPPSAENAHLILSMLKKK